MRSRSTIALAGLVIAFACSGIVKADDYQLVLTRPSKVGDKSVHNVTMTLTTSRKMGLPDAPAAPSVPATPTLTKEQQAAIQSSGVKIPPAGLAALGGGGFGGLMPASVQKSTQGAGNSTSKPDATVLKYEAQVLEIDANGLPTKTGITITEFTKTTSGSTKVLLPAGTKLTKSEGADSTLTSVAGGAANVVSTNTGASVNTGGHIIDTSAKFTADDASVSISKEAELAMVTLSPSHHGHTLDELLGVTGTKKVGDSWPINSQMYVASLEGKQGAVSPDQIKGTATFTKIDTVNAVKCAILDAHITVSDIKPPNLPSNLTIKSAQADMTSQSPVPLDATVPAMGHTTTTHVTVAAEASYSGHAADVTVELITKIDESITPAK